MSWGGAIFRICLLILGALPAFAEEWRVTDFGAVPNDGVDDAPALRKAAEALRGKVGAKLVFPPGRYDLSGGLFGSPSVTFRECEGLVLEGARAELVGHECVSLLVFYKCRDITLNGLTVDWDPLPFTAGKVEAAQAHQFDLKVEAPHTVQPGRPVQAVLEFDPSARRLAKGGGDLYQRDFKELSVKTETGLLRCFVKGPPPKVGTDQIVRHAVYGANALTFWQCQNTRVEGVSVYAAPGMGVYGEGCTDVFLLRLKVIIRPNSGRWMSTTADASHFNNCRGSVTYEDCEFEGMGDDAVNLHSMYLKVVERSGSRDLLLETGRKDAQMPSPVPGDKLEFLSEQTLQTGFVGMVKSVVPEGRKVRVMMESELPESVVAGVVVGNADTCPKARILRCKVKANRARGFLIQTRNVQVEDCEFEDVSGAALHLTSDAHYWWEGQGVRDVVIRNCQMRRCNFGAARGRGVIDVFAEIGKAAAPAGVHRGICIEGNRFFENEGASVHVSSAEDVRMIHNEAIGAHGPFVLLDHCRGVEIIDNKTNDGGKVAEFGVEVDTNSIKIR